MTHGYVNAKKRCLPAGTNGTTTTVIFIHYPGWLQSLSSNHFILFLAATESLDSQRGGWRKVYVNLILMVSSDSQECSLVISGTVSCAAQQVCSSSQMAWVHVHKCADVWLGRTPSPRCSTHTKCQIWINGLMEVGAPQGRHGVINGDYNHSAHYQLTTLLLNERATRKVTLPFGIVASSAVILHRDWNLTVSGKNLIEV